jgi:hypothetical protein
MSTNDSILTNRVYVVVNRGTGFIYGVTQSLNRARALLQEGLKMHGADQIITWSDEPLLK